MRRRVLLGSLTATVAGAGCLTSITDDEPVRLQYLEIDHMGDKSQTFHLLLRLENEIDYWSSVTIEPQSIVTVCDDGWSPEASSLELLVRLDDQSDWKSRELTTGDTCQGVYYDDHRGLGFVDSSCLSTCSDTESESAQDRSNSSTVV